MTRNIVVIPVGNEFYVVVFEDGYRYDAMRAVERWLLDPDFSFGKEEAQEMCQKICEAGSGNRIASLKGNP